MQETKDRPIVGEGAQKEILKDVHKYLSECADYELSILDAQDANSHKWWLKFREWIKEKLTD